MYAYIVVKDARAVFRNHHGRPTHTLLFNETLHNGGGWMHDRYYGQFVKLVTLKRQLTWCDRHWEKNFEMGDWFPIACVDLHRLMTAYKFLGNQNSVHSLLTCIFLTLDCSRIRLIRIA